jgi:hypothetical protein
MTFKRRLFIGYFLGEANGNGTQAARLAGYKSPRKLAQKLLAVPEIREAIEEKVSAVSMTADEVLARISDQATSSLDDFIEVVGKGWRLDLDKARKRGKLHLLRKVKEGQFGPEIELKDSFKALEKLGQYHGLWDKAASNIGVFNAPRIVIPDDDPRTQEG